MGQSFSLLVCQEDLNNSSEREDTRRTAKEQVGLDDDQLVRGCSAREGNLAGFEDILAHIEQQKAALFHGRMAPRVEGLIKQAERLINQQLSADTSADALRDKKAAIVKGMVSLQEGYVEEQSELQKDCAGIIARQVVSAISSFLHGRRETYACQLLDGQDISDLIVADTQNAFQLAVGQNLTPRLKESAQILGKHVEQEAVSKIDISSSSSVFEGNSWSNDLAGMGAGALMGSIVPVIGTFIGALFGAIAGFFSSRSSKKSEAEGIANQAIEAIIKQLTIQTSVTLQTYANRFLTSIREKIEAQLEIEKQNLANIEQQLLAGVQQKQDIEQKAQAALDTVRKLLEQHTKSTTE